MLFQHHIYFRQEQDVPRSRWTVRVSHSCVYRKSFLESSLFCKEKLWQLYTWDSYRTFYWFELDSFWERIHRLLVINDDARIFAARFTQLALRLLQNEQSARLHFECAQCSALPSCPSFSNTFTFSPTRSESWILTLSNSFWNRK